jgi:hypothetical protein
MMGGIHQMSPKINQRCAPLCAKEVSAAALA